MKASVLLLAALVVAAVASVAFGSGGAAGTVRLAMDEWSIRGDREVPAGRVTFETANRGDREHELVVVRTDLPPDDLPRGLEGPAVALAGDVVLGTPHSHHALDRRSAARHIAPGATRRETVRLAPGRYVLLCTIDGHYAAGQRAALVVR